MARDVKLRVWPGVAASVLIVAGLSSGIFLNLALPDSAGIGMLAAIIGALAIAVWWLFFSRARWSERLGVMALLIVAWFATRPLLDESIIGGAMGALPILTFPVLFAGLAVWASATQNTSVGIRRASLLAVILIACGLGTLVRTEGLRGGSFQFHWRWTPTPEDLLLARGDVNLPSLPPAPAETPASDPAPAADADVDPVTVSTRHTAAGKPADWPGFRGPERDSIVRNVRIETDWSKSPPVQLWRRPIGPGWSSFAVGGDIIYTQEQRGNDEIVAAYRLSTGDPVWRHRDAVRFYESNAGAGPRGTPALVNGRVYAFGATGLLNSLDAATGALVWSRNVPADSNVNIPMWGFSSSPLVIDDLVVVAAEGTPVAYGIATGKPRWVGPAGGFSYSSPHLMSIGGIPQIVMLNGMEAMGLAPSGGAVLWRNAMTGGAIMQPALAADGSVLVASIFPTGGLGISSLAIVQESGRWTVNERWTSTGLKPYFNDFVIHNGHAFGFDGSIMSSIDLTDGKRKWKGGRYGAGQLLLLPDQDLLLVISDEGEVALVNATPDEFKELARFKAIEGKSWSHPVLVRDTLILRNAEEMAAFRFKLE